MQPIGTKCDKCNDDGGWFVKEYDEELQYDFEKWKPCTCSVENDIQKLFNASHISAEFQKKTFGNFVLDNRPQPVRDAQYCASQYLQRFPDIRHNRRNSIAICGRPGSGKTHLLMAVANSIIKQEIALLYFPWVELWNNLKDDFSKLDERIRQMQEVDVLYIDDVFKGRKDPTDFQLEQLFAIVNPRYLNKKPILLSSERTIDEIIKIDEGLGSRIAEMCSDFTVYMMGEGLNYRLREDNP